MKRTFRSVLALVFVVLTIACTVIMTSAIAAPTFKVKSVATTSVTLYWTKVSGATDYEIQRSTDAKNWTTIAKNITATEYTDSKGLTTGKSYAYRIRTRKDKLIGSDEYSSWTAYVVGKPLPAKVTGLKVSAANNTTVRLVWNKVAGVSGYTVQYYGGGKWNNYKSVTANTIDVTGLKLGTKYHFRVAAVKVVSGKWIYGAVSDYITTSPVLGATSAVKLAGVNSNAVKLIWAGVSGAKGFEVYNYKTGKWINAGATTTYTINGFNPGEECSFKVRAYAGSVKGKESAVYTFKTAPAVPSNVTIKEVTESSLTYTWDPVDGAEGYQAAYYTRANGKWITLPLTTGTTITVSGLPGLTECGFCVRAYLQNKNVHNISTYATSAYSANKVGKTALPAPTVSAVKSTAADQTSIKWSAVTGASGYSIEKYNVTTLDWTVYDFTKCIWVSASDVTAENNIVTTATTFTSTGDKDRADVYRVRAYDNKGNKGTVSGPVTAFTSTLAMNNTAGTFVLQQIVYWYKTEGATKYKIIARNPAVSVEEVAVFDASKVENANSTVCQASIYMAPNSIHSIMIQAFGESETTPINSSGWITFNVGNMYISSSTSDKYYNASVNSQLLYLAQAINNTKGYKGAITVSNNSSISQNITYFKMPLVLIALLDGSLPVKYPQLLVNGGAFDTPEMINDLFASLDESGEMKSEMTETYNASVLFQNGTGKGPDDKTVYLRTFIEPAVNGTYSAKLHNSQNYSAWKNGFSSVSTKKNTDGSVTMKVTFKKESMSTPYHSGFLSSISLNDFTSVVGDSFEVKKFEVGASTLEVTIDKDGYLKSYKSNSPFAAHFVANFTVEEGSEDLEAGSLVSMEMAMSGKSNYNYAFTR